MDWSPQQDEALQAVDRWLKSTGGSQVFRLFGYAGTGKTTLARHLAKSVKGTVIFCAFTGKAAHVLQEKGCPDARTIHSLIYLPREKSRLRLRQLELALSQLDEDDTSPEAEKLAAEVNKERDNLARPSFTLNTESDVQDAALIVLDECSMVDAIIGQDLLSFGTPVLVLGDPAQLPPVRGGGFFTDCDPDIMLTEIHRQARDNPIIRMATMVRQGETLELDGYGEGCRVIGSNLLGPDCAMNADQILVGRNVTRRGSNVRLRELLGFDSSYPLPGDKLVCLRNDHEIGLLNGSLWETIDVGEMGTDRMFLSVRTHGDPKAEVLAVEAHTQNFTEGGNTLPWFERCEAQEFDFGYALTVHKAQGSQWDDVLLLDESSVFRNDRNRWLYTGLTRAAKTVTVVKM